MQTVDFVFLSFIKKQVVYKDWGIVLNVAKGTSN